jgi:hypothetical protein
VVVGHHLGGVQIGGLSFLLKNHINILFLYDYLINFYTTFFCLATKPDVTVAISDEDLLSVIGGKLNMMSAFTQKKLKITGNMSVAMKLNSVFTSVIKTQSKL